MEDKDLPDFFIVLNAEGDALGTFFFEEKAHEFINDAGADGVRVRNWVVRKYVPVRRYKLA